VNAVLAEGGTVSVAPDMMKTAEGMERGAFVIGGIGKGKVEELAAKYAVGAVSTTTPDKAIALKKARVGLYRPWNPSIDEGWTRWVLEQYNFDAKSLYNADIRSAGLRGRYDVIVIPDMRSEQLMNGFRVGSVPGQYAGGIEKAGLENLRDFVRSGGTLVAMNGAASALIPLMSLPVKNTLQGLSNDKFYCAGSLLRVESQHPEMPINFGVPASPVVMFERGPAFETLPGFKGAVLAKYPKQGDALESGMIIHQEVLQDQIAALEVSYGRGRIFLYGFKPQQRGQAHGTYRYLFNALYSFDDPPMPADAPSAKPAVVADGAAPAAGAAASAAPAGGAGGAAAGARRRGTGATP